MSSAGKTDPRKPSPRRFLALIVQIVIAFGAMSPAHAFKILSALTDGCHEKLTLGTLGRGSAGFVGDGLPSTAPLIARFIQRVQADGVPQDDASRGLRRENSNRYGWGSLSDAEQFVLASFLAGVRAPDTGGYSIVDFSQIRRSHIRDDEQSAHFLRRKTGDGSAGDLAVIQETTSRLTTLAASVLSTWATSAPANRQARWTFAFYGEHDVTVFAPAYDLGLIAHAIQDSYAHALRDENDLKVIAVANYLEVVLREYADGRDGPGHSERLDQCNEHDPFDRPRINEARLQTARAFSALDQQMAVNGQNLTGFQTSLNDTFAYKSGCDHTNAYCNGLWYQKALEEISEPYEVGCGLVKTHPDGRDDHHPRNPRTSGFPMRSSLSRAAMVFCLLVMPLFITWMLRRRFRN